MALTVTVLNTKYDAYKQGHHTAKNNDGGNVAVLK